MLSRREFGALGNEMKILRIGAAYALLGASWVLFGISALLKLLSDGFLLVAGAVNDLSRVVTPKNSP